MMTLTSAQEKIVANQIAAGQYGSAEEMLDVALELLTFSGCRLSGLVKANSGKNPSWYRRARSW